MTVYSFLAVIPSHPGRQDWIVGIIKPIAHRNSSKSQHDGENSGRSSVPRHCKTHITSTLYYFCQLILFNGFRSEEVEWPGKTCQPKICTCRRLALKKNVHLL